MPHFPFPTCAVSVLPMLLLDINDDETYLTIRLAKRQKTEAPRDALQFCLSCAAAALMEQEIKIKLGAKDSAQLESSF